MSVVYVLWDTYDDDHVRGVYGDLKMAVEAALRSSDAERKISAKLEIGADDIRKFIDYIENATEHTTETRETSVFEEANENRSVDLTRWVERLLGDRQLDFKVMLPLDGQVLARVSHCDRRELCDKFIFTPIKIDASALQVGELWILVTLADDGPYGSVTTIEYSHSLALIYEEFDNYMSVEHNRDDSDRDSSSEECRCGSSLDEGTCWASSCRLCDNNRMDECSQTYFLRLLRDGNISLEHCSSEASVSLLKFKHCPPLADQFPSLATLDTSKQPKPLLRLRVRC